MGVYGVATQVDSVPRRLGKATELGKKGVFASVTDMLV